MSDQQSSPRELLREVLEWFDDADTKAAFTSAWIHGTYVSKEKSEQCGELWARVRKSVQSETAPYRCGECGRTELCSDVFCAWAGPASAAPSGEESETPRTDEAEGHVEVSPGKYEFFVQSSFGRQLERELNAARSATGAPEIAWWNFAVKDNMIRDGADGVSYIKACCATDSGRDK